MRFFTQFLVVKLILEFSPSFCGDAFDEDKSKWPTVGISVLVRNKAHVLPYFLSALAQLDYPKDRLYIWLYSDYNQDKSIEIIEDWVSSHESEYHGIYLTANRTTGPLHSDESNTTHWSPEHFKHVLRLREEALRFAREKWAEFVFMVDADVFFINPQTLKHLVKKNVEVVSPMLLSDGMYSNFWCGMTDTYYYKRTDDYKPILNRTKVGCFEVPMVHSAVLISMTHADSDRLTYDPEKITEYKGPEDDIIAFAISAKKHGIPLHICNDHMYGFIPVPLEDGQDPRNDYEQILNLKLEIINSGHTLHLEPNLEPYIQYPEKWKFNCDEIYILNLERRTERREKMERSIRELGIDATFVNAVDGRNMDINDLSKYSVTLMPKYLDPYHKRPLRAGEVGCFLSHYYIWEKIVMQHHAVTLVLEDDIHFTSYFRHRFQELLQDIKQFDWDLVYIGRKRNQDEVEVYETPTLLRPAYSYWTIGYLISERGARKLLDAKPLTKLLPVDEFLPIMFDKHPNEDWKSYFPNRNLNAFSAEPLLVYPTHYTGQAGYISDTEDSKLLDLALLTNVKNEL